MANARNTQTAQKHTTTTTHPVHAHTKPGSGIMPRANVANESTEEELAKKTKKIVNFGATPFEVTTKTIRAIADTIRERHENKGEGSPARDLALVFCGDEKFAPVISFVIGKYLADEIETTPGLGFTVRGLPKPVAPPIEVTPKTLQDVERLLTDLLKDVAPGGRGISEDQLVMVAASKGMLNLTESNLPDDREVRAAVHALCSGPEAHFEQARGSGIRKRQTHSNHHKSS